MNWITKYWATLGGIVALSIIVVILFDNKKLINIQPLFWIHLAILLLHQFEEYSFPGNFKKFYNTNIWNKNRITRFSLNDKGIIIINVAFAWTVYLIAAFVGLKAIWLTIGLLGVTLLNGMMHSLMFFSLNKYNPGLITGFFFFIPFGIYFLQKLKEYFIMENLVLGLLVFVIGTALIPITIRLTNNKTVPTNKYQ